MCRRHLVPPRDLNISSFLAALCVPLVVPPLFTSKTTPPPNKLYRSTINQTLTSNFAKCCLYNLITAMLPNVTITDQWYSLGFKDDLVCAPVSGLWNGCAAPVWICRVRGRWDTGKAIVVAGAEASLWWWLQAANCSAQHSLFQWCTCYSCECTPVGVDLGSFVEFRRLGSHQASDCSSVCVCSAYVVSLVFFVLVLVHQRTAALVCAHCPSGWCAQASGVGFQQHHFERSWFDSVQWLQDW